MTGRRLTSERPHRASRQMLRVSSGAPAGDAGTAAVPAAMGRAATTPAWFVLAGGTIASAVAALVGDEHLVQPALTVAGLATSLALVAGVRLHRPSRPLPWWLLAACVAMIGVGEALLYVSALAVVGQAVLAIGSAAGFLGLVLLVRPGLSGQTRSSLIDAAIFAVGLGTALWGIGLAPLTVGSNQSSLAAAAFLYPALLALVILARLWNVGGAGRVASRLLFLIVVSTVVIIALDLGQGLGDPETFTGPLILAEFFQFTLFAVLGLHPSMAAAAQGSPARTGRVSGGAMAGLLAALLLNPLSVLVEFGLGREPDVARYVVGGVLLAGLVMARIVDGQARLDRAMARQDALTARLTEQALSDELTALPNRRAFDGLVKAAFEEQVAMHPVALVVLDLDDFKAINDTYGHETGDAVLSAVGSRLRETMRGGDVAARLGGDEFVVVLRDCPSAAAAVAAARRIQEAIALPLRLGELTHELRASAGVAMATGDDLGVEDLMRRADAAMYQAKARAEASVVIHPGGDRALDHDRPAAGAPAQPTAGS